MVSYDVIICGGGPLGLFSAYELSSRGVRCAIVDKNPIFGKNILNSLQTLWPSPNDPPTRAEVAHGHDMALALGVFCQEGCKLFAGHWKAFCSTTPALRISTQDFERVELQKAVALNLGLESTDLGDVFMETDTAWNVNGADFLEFLKNDGVFRKVDLFQGVSVSAVQESATRCVLTLDDGRILNSEMSLLANGYQICELLPKYKSILVPMSDALSVYHGKTGTLRLKDSAVRSHSGHAAGVLKCSPEGNFELRISGPRFLLPQAGAGIDLTRDISGFADIQNRLRNFHEKTLFPMFSTPEESAAFKASSARVSCILGVDCLPCDELPVLGELGRFGRVFGSAGWLGVGLSASCQAAVVLSDLIRNGKSAGYDVRFSPHRFDTMG